MSYGRRTEAVYRWEWANVDKYDRVVLSPSQIRGIVGYVWSSYGFVAPPKVVFHDESFSTGSRFQLTFSEKVNTVTVLHELAHAMDSSLEVEVGIRDMRTREWYDDDAHGPNWLGLYVNCLDKFMPQPEFRKLYLMNSLAAAGLDFLYAPRPRCV